MIVIRVVNGISVWNGVPKGAYLSDTKGTREAMLFDVNTLRADELIGFEWHNPSSTPMLYNTTGAGNDGAICGTAIFWIK